MNFLQSTSSLRRLCDYYVSPAPCKPLSGGARNATRGVDPRKEGNKAKIGTGQPRYKEWISGGPEGIERE